MSSWENDANVGERLWGAFYCIYNSWLSEIKLKKKFVAQYIVIQIVIVIQLSTKDMKGQKVENTI